MNAALRLRGIRKTFGTTVALDGVDLEVAPGEIHALVGENGAGKSTLAAIAYGSLASDAGDVERTGTVGLVHQHFALVERLCVWENIVLGHEPRRGVRLDRDAARARVVELSRTYGLAVDPDAIVETLPVAIRQRVELLRELSREPSVLLLDEPTASLVPAEAETLFATVATLAQRGTAVVVVTHKLAEVMAHSRRVTVMRGGKVVAREETAKTDAGALARAMVGGALPQLTARTETVPRAGLRLDGVSAGTGAGALRNCTLAVAAGEVVGIAGVEGNGQSALADALAGMLPYEGTIAIGDDVLRSPQSPASMRDAGIATIPQDRTREALVLEWTLAENAILGRQRTLRSGAFVNTDAAARFAGEIIAAYDVRPPRTNARARTLSGGNQQKIVVGRALAGRPRAVVAYGPTRGIDVGAATLVQSRLVEARNSGTAVLLISFELDEIFAIADRIVVLQAGRIAGTFAREGVDRAAVGALMAGAR